MARSAARARIAPRLPTRPRDGHGGPMAAAISGPRWRRKDGRGLVDSIALRDRCGLPGTGHVIEETQREEVEMDRKGIGRLRDRWIAGQGRGVGAALALIVAGLFSDAPAVAQPGAPVAKRSAAQPLTAPGEAALDTPEGTPSASASAVRSPPTSAPRRHRLISPRWRRGSPMRSAATRRVSPTSDSRPHSRPSRPGCRRRTRPSVSR